MAFGAGVLISALAFELTAEVSAGWQSSARGVGGRRPGLLRRRLGARAPRRRPPQALRRRAGRRRRRRDRARRADGRHPGVRRDRRQPARRRRGGRRRVAAVFLSNVPESLSAADRPGQAGHSPRWILGLWARSPGLRARRGGSATALLGGASPPTVAVIQAFAAGAILTMLADTMMPEAFEHGGKVGRAGHRARLRARLPALHPVTLRSRSSPSVVRPMSGPYSGLAHGFFAWNFTFGGTFRAAQSPLVGGLGCEPLCRDGERRRHPLRPGRPDAHHRSSRPRQPPSSRSSPWRCLPPHRRAPPASRRRPSIQQSGFPLWYQDSKGDRVEQCLDANDPNCIVLAGPTFNPAAPLTSRRTSPTSSSTRSRTPTSSPRPAAARPPRARPRSGSRSRAPSSTAIPAPNEQIVFGRIRVKVSSGLCPNTTYQFRHPFGTETLKTNDAGAIPANVGTEDIGCIGIVAAAEVQLRPGRRQPHLRLA